MARSFGGAASSSALAFAVAALLGSSGGVMAREPDAKPPQTAEPTTTTETTATAPRLVDVTTRIPDAVLDLRYATEHNFLGRKVYPDGARCLLLPETLEKLVKAADTLRAQGFRLRLYDCYRPRSVQWEMWKILPKPGYVADPRRGSHHNRGAAVDLGLSNMKGEEVEHPTPFDTFNKAAHHGYAGASEAAIRHREVLREAMEGAGFRKNRMEWWHYALPKAGRFPVLDEPLTETKTKREPATSPQDAGTAD